MSEINMDFSFPAAPASAPGSAPGLAPPFGHPHPHPRPLSFSPQSRPRKHAHRRSAAMSEDLKATDLSVLTAPQLAASTTAASSGSPSSASLRSTASGASGASSTSGVSSASQNASAHAYAGSSAVTFAPLPQVPPLPTSTREASPRHRGSFDLREARPRMPFAGSSPSTPMRRSLGNVGEPGELVPASPVASPSPLPSPREEVVRRKPRERSKRRSFVRVFKRSRDFDSGGDDTLTPHDDDDPVQRLPSPTPPLPPPEAPRTPEMSSPILTPRNSGEALRDLEPEPPRIDLDEALSCSFEHRKPEGILESPFSKASSIIGTVPEEEEESDAASLASLSQLRPGALLHKANSVHSASSLSRSSGSLKPSARPINIANTTTPILVSPSRGDNQVPDKRQFPVAPRGQDQLAHLAIIEPRASPPASKPVEVPRNGKGHARRRSLISRIMGRHH